MAQPSMSGRPEARVWVYSGPRSRSAQRRLRRRSGYPERRRDDDPDAMGKRALRI